MTQFLLLLALGITVFAVLAYDARLYHGVGLDGGPIYPEREDLVNPWQDVGSNAVPDNSALSSTEAPACQIGEGLDRIVAPAWIPNTATESSPRPLAANAG